MANSVDIERIIEEPTTNGNTNEPDTDVGFGRNRSNTHIGWLHSIFRSSSRTRGRIRCVVNEVPAQEHFPEDLNARISKRKVKRRRNTMAENQQAIDSDGVSYGRFSWRSLRQYFKRLRSRSERSVSTSSEASNITIDIDGRRLEDSPVLPRSNSNAGISLDGETTSGCLLLKPPVKDNEYCIPRMIYKVVNCPWYWGNINRFDAAVALQAKVDGYFLLRKSAHPEYLFTISFKRFNKTMHVRIETGYDGAEGQDSYEETIFLPWIMPGKFSPTYTRLLELIDHCCEPYEGKICNTPLLVTPLNRRTPFSLKDLSRAAIYKWCLYSDLDVLQIPEELKAFLKEYKYKSKLGQE